MAFARWTPRGSEINREEIAMDLEREDHPFQVVGTAALGALPSRHWDVHMRQEAESGARNREEVERRRSGVRRSDLLRRLQNRSLLSEQFGINESR